MFEEIKKFMHQQDRNGDWLACDINEAEYMFNTINDWLQDGLELTPQIQDYLGYLSYKMFN